MTIRSPKSRRRVLRGLAVGLASGVAGCTQSSATPERSFAAEESPPCAADIDILEHMVSIDSGTPPEVQLKLRNRGDIPVRYELTVTFQQATSTGKDVRTGQSTLSGRLGAGDTVIRTATDDAYEIENTDSYSLTASITCLS